MNGAPREVRQSQDLKDLAKGLGQTTFIEWQSISLGAPKPTELRFPVVVAEWPRNDHEIIRVSLDRFNGRQMIDVRGWWHDKDAGWRAGRGGLTLNVSHLPDLAFGFAEALSIAPRVETCRI
jgi:Transcriptional Coactivator p15 (PC4)